jgi:hypothetical protein
LLVLLFLRKYLAGRPCQSDETFLGTASFDSSVASKYLCPALLEEHNPDFAMVGFGVNRGGSGSLAGESIISCYNFPLSVNEKFDCVIAGWVDVEEKPFSDEFRIN